MAIDVEHLQHIVNVVLVVQEFLRRRVLKLMGDDRLPDGQGLVLVGHPFLDIGLLPGFQAGNVLDLVGTHLDVGNHAGRGGGRDAGVRAVVRGKGDLQEPFKLRIVVDPGRVHHAADPFDLGGHFQPGRDPLRVGIIVACQDLAVAAVGEEFQARGVVLVPVGHQDAGGQALPGTVPRAAALGQVHPALFAGVVKWIEHVVPGQDRLARSPSAR